MKAIYLLGLLVISLTAFSLYLRADTVAVLNPDLTFRELRTYPGTPTVAQIKPGRWRPIVITGQPAFNPSNQKVIQAGWIIALNDARPNWQVVALNASELDAKQDAADAEQLRQLYTKIKAGTATAAEQRAVVAFLLKDYAKRNGLTAN